MNKSAFITWNFVETERIDLLEPVKAKLVAVAYVVGLYRLTTKYSGGAVRGVVSWHKTSKDKH